MKITLPERLLVQIDSFAARHGDTRSELLAHAALEYVAAHDDAAKPLVATTDV